MPTITKQNPKGNDRPNATGSILSLAVPVERMSSASVKILIYGKNRVGKTTLACQFPKPLLLVSFEPVESGGTESVKKIAGVRVLKEGVHFKGPDGAVLLARELARGEDDYKTIVIDGATSLQDVVLRDIMGVEEKPVQMSWGTVQGDEYMRRSEKTREVLWEFLKQKRDVVILAKEKDHNPPKEERTTASGKVMPDMRPKFLRGMQQSSWVSADLGGATAEWLQDAVDYICRLYVDEEIEEQKVKVGNTVQTVYNTTGKYVRCLRTGYHPNYAAGSRSSEPEGFPEVIVEPTYEKILEAIRGK